MRKILNIVAIASIAHALNRAYCEAIGDQVPPVWDETTPEHQNSLIKGVELHLSNPNATPEESHLSWLKVKEAEGWVYGEVKDAEAKTHPCIRPYSELPESQRAKDYLFRQTVHSLAPYLEGQKEIVQEEVLEDKAAEQPEVTQKLVEQQTDDAILKQGQPIQGPVKLTRGQIAMGINFNPSRNPLVDKIKQQCADVVDTIEEYRDNVKGDANSVQGEKLAQSQIAIRSIQEGQMWAVKSVTLEPQS